MPYNPLDLIQALSQQAGPRGFTYAGRPANSGMSLGDILSRRGTIGDMDEGNLAKPAPTISLQERLAGDAIPKSVMTNYINPAVVGRNVRSNVTNMMGMGNAENLPQPLSQDFQDRANAEQAGIFGQIKDLYNYLFPYDLNVSDFLPK